MEQDREIDLQQDESVSEAADRAEGAAERDDPASGTDTPRDDLGSEPSGAGSITLADIGENPRGQGQDRMGGYGNTPIAQEPGPDQDEGLSNNPA